MHTTLGWGLGARGWGLGRLGCGAGGFAGLLDLVDLGRTQSAACTGREGAAVSRTSDADSTDGELHP